MTSRSRLVGEARISFPLSEKIVTVEQDFSRHLANRAADDKRRLCVKALAKVVLQMNADDFSSVNTEATKAAKACEGMTMTAQQLKELDGILMKLLASVAEMLEKKLFDKSFAVLETLKHCQAWMEDGRKRELDGMAKAYALASALHGFMEDKVLVSEAVANDMGMHKLRKLLVASQESKGFSVQGLQVESAMKQLLEAVAKAEIAACEIWVKQSHDTLQTALQELTACMAIHGEGKAWDHDIKAILVWEEYLPLVTAALVRVEPMKIRPLTMTLEKAMYRKAQNNGGGTTQA